MGLMEPFVPEKRARYRRTHGFADYESLGIPSFSINSYSVGRLMPSSRAAEVILPCVTAQGVLDHLPFHTFPRFLQRLERQGTQRIGQFQVPGGDALAIRHDDRPPHPVLQLADVSRPAVKTQGAQRIGREIQTGFGVLDAIVAAGKPSPPG